jgi:hypothetical protein
VVERLPTFSLEESLFRCKHIQSTAGSNHWTTNMNVIKLGACLANRTSIFIIAVEMRLVIFVFLNNDTVGSGIMTQCTWWVLGEICERMTQRRHNSMHY